MLQTTPPRALKPSLGALNALTEALETDVLQEVLETDALPETQGAPDTHFANKKSEKKPFRLCARRLYLTYSQVHPEMNSNDAMVSKRLNNFEHKGLNSL